MASAGLLALLDDVAALAKLAAKKTAGISGDDMALNSKALMGIEPRRELPIVGKVAAGSLINKAILIPAALGLSAAAPWTIMPLMMLGGGYLCFEGVEKLIHAYQHKGDHAAEKEAVAVLNSKELEKQKVWGAIKTDFILSAEIVVVALGAMAAAPLLTKAAALTVVGIGMTAGVYGAVAGLVKMDDIGLHLMEKQGTNAWSKLQRKCGKALVNTAPVLLKGISVLGTAAMFTVGGGILVHGIPAAHHAVEGALHAITSNAIIGGALEMAATGILGVAAGAIALGVVKLAEKPIKAITKVFKKPASVQKSQSNHTATPEPAPSLPAPGTLSAALNTVAPLQQTTPQSTTPALKSPAP